MMQTALPASDVSDGGWTPTPVYPELRKAAPDDSTFVSSSSNPQGDYFEVKLDPLAWPQTGQGAGPETLKVRLRQTGGGAALPVWVVLVQGGTVIAAQNYQPTAAFAEYDMVLTSAQVAAITNYADLRVRVYADGPVTSCCPGVTLPAVLYAHFTNGTGACACLNNFVVPLTYSASGGGWNGNFISPCNGQSDNMLLDCNGPGVSNWQLFIGAGTFTLDSASKCSPLSFLFHNQNGQGAICDSLSGNFDVVILTTT